MIIFDGLDESRFQLDFKNNETLFKITDEQSVDVLLTNIIKRNLLPEALLWITSRPAAANKIPCKHIDQVTVVRGFNDEQKKEYFRKKVKDEKLARRIISHVTMSRSLHIMCQIPIFCWIAAMILGKMLSEKVSGVPETLTAMYTHFLVTLTDFKDQTNHTNPQKVLKQNRSLILKIGHLAFKHLGKAQMFYEKDLEECGITDEERKGSLYSAMFTEILKKEEVIYSKIVYYFVHLTIQEFFASLFVFHCFISNEMNDLKYFINVKFRGRPKVHTFLKRVVKKASQSENGHLDLLVRFLHGFLLESNQQLLEGLLTRSNNAEAMCKMRKYLKYMPTKDISPERCINLFHCLIEMGDKSLNEDIQAYLSHKDKKKSSVKLTADHCSALASVLLKSGEELDEFDLRKYKASWEKRNRLVPAVRCCRKALLAGCRLTNETCETVADALRSANSPLRELDLSQNDLQDSGVKLLSAGLGDPHCELEILRLSDCHVTEDGCAFLASALRLNPSHLRELDLSFNHPGDSGVKLLSARLDVDHNEEFWVKPQLLKECFVGDGITCYDLQLCAGGSCCRQGYRWSSELGCVDVDECSLPNPTLHPSSGSVVTGCEACHLHATCHASLLTNEVEVESSSSKLVTCNCKSGFVGDGITCYDLQLCAGGSCCRQGYRWSSELGCVDVDECSLPNRPCTPPQVCENTPGSFDCLVPPEDDLRTSPRSDSRSVQFQCGGRRCPVGEDCISVGGTSLCADPCQFYTVLNDAWRSTTNNGAVNGEHCDMSVNWQGWYRLFLGNTSVQMPERCVERYMCGTHAPMWLTDPHPQLSNSVVQRGVCGNWASGCCSFKQGPIHVKACYGNYYVYKFVPAVNCHLAYCADVNTKVCSTCRNDETCMTLELVCGRNFIQVGLQMVNLEAGRLDPSSAHLADPRCSAHQKANGTVWYQVERREGRCGNTLETNATHAVYSNSLFVYPFNTRNDSLSRPVSLPFSCAYPLETESSLDVAIKPYLLTEGGVSGLGAKAKSFMSLYRNTNFTKPYPPGEVLLPVGSALHVGVSVDETDDQLVVILENCYATHTPNFDDLMRYVLIQNRCPSNQRQVRVEESGSSLRARFSALLFLYQGDYRDVFLHCSLSLCDQRSSSCTPCLVSPWCFCLRVCSL
ncbi:uncharacterized protein LOC121532883 [Coregonus clupeaformis]|uniref:uncharacterized protein LOC121532883 n=1 Tax=Coregonus clupeaformis TaxID=59861 RepID=UPI001E1C7F60|nr:uncharacterized protein LOC121532883 [Coregonus clupeaformis]